MSRKGTSNTKSQKAAVTIVYPPNCLEIKESLQKDELIKRLKDLYTKFQEFDQDDANNEKYKPLASYFASRFFFDHVDREVRMYTACILADAMRIFAPNAPFSPSQLKDVLRFFVKQLSELQNHTAPIYRHAYYLLDIITSTRVFCAYIDFEEECASFFSEVFECVLNAIRKEHAPNVKNLITELCVPILQESPVISSEMLDSLFARLVEPSRSVNPVAYKLVLDIILKAKDVLEPVMLDFFRSAMLSGSSGDSAVSKDAYTILFELCVGIPDVVHTALSAFLRDALELPQEPLRLAAVRFAGQLFSRSSGVGAIFASKYATLWATYIGRSKDASLTIRTSWVKQSIQILTALSYTSTDEIEMSKSVFDRLITRATDVDAQIRLAVIDAAVSLCQHDITRVPDELLRKIEELTRDKHAKTRSSAVLALGRIYRRVCVPLPTDKKSATKSVSADTEADGDGESSSTGDGPVVFSAEQKKRVYWIRNKILHLYAGSLLEDRALVERVLYACLVPVTSLDIHRRLQELVSLYSSLDEAAIACFDSLIRCQSSLREVVHRWACSHLGSTEGLPATQGSQLTVLVRMLPADSCPSDALAQLDRMLSSNRTLAERLKAASDIRCSSSKAADLATEIVKMLPAEQKQKSSSLLGATKFILERTLPLLVSGPSLVGILRIILNLTAGQTLPHTEITIDSVLPVLRLCNLVASVFKSACLGVDPALVEEATDPDHFKYVLDHFVSLFDQLSSQDALAVVAQTLPHLITSPAAFQNQSAQFYLTIHALQSTLSHLALRSHISLAKQATKCLIHLLATSEYIRVMKPIVDCRVIQIATAMKKITAEGSSTAECTPNDSPPSTSESDIHSAVVSYYSVARVATYLPKSFFNDMRALTVDSYTWLNDNLNKPVSFHPTLRVAALKFLARWLSSLRQDQPVQNTLVKKLAECIANHVRILATIDDLNAGANKDALFIGQAAASAAFRLLRSCEPNFMTLPSATAISLAMLMSSLDAKTLRNALRPLFVKVQRLFINHILPPFSLAIMACSFVSPDKDVRTTMRQIVEKLVSAWRLQAQHQTIPAAIDLPSSSEGHVVPLQNLPDSLLPGAIVLLSFIATNNVTQLESCRSALSTIFEILTSRPVVSSSDNPQSSVALKAAAGLSEHLPLCRGLISKLKTLSLSVSSSYVPPEYTQSWSENSLSAMINVALAEIPTEKGAIDSFAIELESRPFFAVIGPLCELFQNPTEPKSNQKQISEQIHSATSAPPVPLLESGKGNLQQKPSSTSATGNLSDLGSTPVLHHEPPSQTEKEKETKNSTPLEIESNKESPLKPEATGRGKGRKGATNKEQESTSASSGNDNDQEDDQEKEEGIGRPKRAVKRPASSPVAASKPATRRRK